MATCDRDRYGVAALCAGHAAKARGAVTSEPPLPSGWERRGSGSPITWPAGPDLDREEAIMFDSTPVRTGPLSAAQPGHRQFGIGEQRGAGDVARRAWEGSFEVDALRIGR
jgi:hypothetical protein